MEEIFEKLMEVDEEQEDRYDPKKNLRSKIIDMFYKEEFSLVDEHRSATGTHLEFRKEDTVIKVIIPDQN